MLEKYKKYLQVLNIRLSECFEKHKQFIACYAGCGICCKSSYYAASKLEYDYVREGFNKLNDSQKEAIQQKALELLKERREFLKTNSDVFAFAYSCPFLVNNSCIIYEYRPLLCRAYGLMYKDVEKEGKLNIPYCANLDLNYANIWDKDLKRLSPEKMFNLGLEGMPEAFDTSYSSLIRDAGDIDFGEVRMIFEWIIFDIPNYEEIVSK